MKSNLLKAGQKLFFKGEGIPMELIARTKRYAVVVRSLDIEEDYDLIYFQVERGAYFDTKSAYEDLKDEPVYSLIDFKEGKKAPSNMVFCMYDFFSKKDCEKAVADLEKGEHELSTRHGAELNIDWDRTLEDIKEQ
jgi:hypothetical protein